MIQFLLLLSLVTGQRCVIEEIELREEVRSTKIFQMHEMTCYGYPSMIDVTPEFERVPIDTPRNDIIVCHSHNTRYKCQGFNLPINKTLDTYNIFCPATQGACWIEFTLKNIDEPTSLARFDPFALLALPFLVIILLFLLSQCCDHLGVPPLK